MKKVDILLEAANIIDHNTRCLQESHCNPETKEIKDEKVAAQCRREYYIASKLREYAKRV